VSLTVESGTDEASDPESDEPVEESDNLEELDNN